MAVLSLRYDPTATNEETKNGSFVFDGAASKFHQWEFSSTMKYAATKKDDKPATMSRIVEGLRGEAANVAFDIGHENLLDPDNGLSALVDG